MLELRHRAAAWTTFLVACASGSSSAPRAVEDRHSSTPTKVTSADAAAPDTSTTARCIVVQGEGEAAMPAVLEGVLVATQQSSLPFMLRLRAPRCVVGLARGSVATEVAVATAGPDLRPFLGARVRIGGDVLAGENDMGGAGLVLLAKDLTRLEVEPREP